MGLLRDFLWRGRSRPAFSTLNLVIALAVFALVSLMLGIQAGDINPAIFMPAGKSAGKTPGSKPPAFLLPDQLPVDSASPGSETSIDPLVLSEELAITSLPEDAGSRLLTFKAFGLMDPALAAERLHRLNDNDATLILASQKRRDLAYILEMADPADAANWVNILLQIDGRLPPLPAGDSVLDQLNADPADAEATTDEQPAAADSGLEPDATVSTVSLLPDYMLSPDEREAFLAEFPQYRTDKNMDGTTGTIPVISDFSISE